MCVMYNNFINSLGIVKKQKKIVKILEMTVSVTVFSAVDFTLSNLALFYVLGIVLLKYNC